MNKELRIMNYKTVGELHAAELSWPPRMRISLPRHDLLREERWPNSQRRRTLNLFLNGLLLGLICIGIQDMYIKLINHCQAVVIKQ